MQEGHARVLYYVCKILLLKQSKYKVLGIPHELDAIFPCTSAGQEGIEIQLEYRTIASWMFLTGVIRVPKEYRNEWCSARALQRLKGGAGTDS